MNKDKMQELAEDIFNRYPNQNSVYVSSDGQAFFDQSHAMNHARKNRTGKELKVESFKRPDSKTEKEDSKTPAKTAKELIESLKMANIDEVNIIVETEKELGENARKSVFTAAEKRLSELVKTE